MVKRIVIAALASIFVLGQNMAGLTERQAAALARIGDGLAPQGERVTAARAAMIRAAYAEPRDDDGMRKEAEAVGAAELALANARADAFAALQASEAKPAPNGVAARNAAGGVYRGGGTIPNIREAQTEALTRLTDGQMALAASLDKARAAIVAAALAEPRDEGAIRSKAEAIQAAELRLAKARADAFAEIQSSANRLAPAQVAAFVDMGGSFASVRFTMPEPLHFSDHEGYASLFDGVSLKGWDGNPKFWRVEGGAIVGESTVENPSGNTYLVYRDMVAKDFTLKFEIKIEGTGGSGLQYRSRTGIPWSRPIPANVTANVGPVNLAWMMTGPQADFWPSSRDWTGQFYSENTPMRIQAWRGQVVEGAGLARKQLMGNIGDRQVLNGVVKMNDWNDYTVIARGGTLMHILNGQLMAVMVDDDPESSNNQAGLFGIEIEATTRVSVRNIWVKKFN